MLYASDVMSYVVHKTKYKTNYLDIISVMNSDFMLIGIVLVFLRVFTVCQKPLPRSRNSKSNSKAETGTNLSAAKLARDLFDWIRGVI